MTQKTLYERLGGYDGITAFTNDLLPRLLRDPLLGRFWQNRGDDGIERENNYLSTIYSPMQVALCTTQGVI